MNHPVQGDHGGLTLYFVWEYRHLVHLLCRFPSCLLPKQNWADNTQIPSQTNPGLRADESPCNALSMFCASIS